MARSTVKITADHHFGHDKIIGYENRPFPTARVMDEMMIQNWNETVSIYDWVLHLGDFSLLSPSRTIEICKELNGCIILFNGNHDHRTRTFWEERAGIHHWFKRPQYVAGVWLTHAVDFWNGKPKIWTGKLDNTEVLDTDLVLHGHCHGRIQRKGQFINVGVDSADYKPLDLIKLIPKPKYEALKSWIENLTTS